MKKAVFISILISATLVFVGCSLFSESGSKKNKSDFVLSQSIGKSIDGGLTWEIKNQGTGKANATNVDVLSFAMNPFDKDNLYVGLRQGGILETSNGGETWSFINYQSEKVYGLALDPLDGRTLYASGVWKGRGKIFKTENKGVKWEEIYTSPANGPLVISLMIDKRDPDVLYATTSEKEVIKTVDGGKSWKNVYLANAPVLKVAIDATNSSLVYLLSNDGNVFRSKDGGNNFENINSKIIPSSYGIGPGGFSVLEASPITDGRVFLAGAEGIIFSDNGGEKWKSISVLNNPDRFPVRAMAINPKNSKEIVYAMDQATYKSIDEGKTWTTSQFSNGMKINVLKYDPAGSGELYVGFIK